MDKLDDDDRRADGDSRNNFWIILLLLVLLLFLLGLIIQRSRKDGSSQTTPQVTQTTTQPTSQAISPTTAQVTNAPCSSVPYYCLINGKGICVRPTTCPTQQLTCNPVPLPSKVTIHFDFNKATLRPADMPALNQFAAIMKQDPLATITIEGNTDSIPFAPGTKGPITNNQALSWVRALVAKNYLISKGVTANIYKLKGYGYSKPVSPNSINGKDNPAGRALNRRDDITASSTAPLCSKPTPTLGPTATPTPTLTPTPTPTLCRDNSINSLQGGYTFSPPATTTKQLSVSAQWNVVNATCKPNEQGFTSWTGIKTNDMLIQAGSYAWCSSAGTVQYFPWTMAFPGPMANPPNVDTVTPGDTMYSSITMTKPGSFVINLLNITKGWSYQVNANDSGFTSLSPNSGQVFIQDEPAQGAQSPPQLSQFSPDVNFTNGQFSINSSALAPLASAPGLQCHNIIRNKVILEQTSGITQGDFNETWEQP